MAKATDQIFRELGAFFNPSARILKNQRAGIGESVRNEVQKARDLRDKNIQSVQREAQRRGVTFSGFTPLEEARAFGNFETQAGDIRARGRDARVGLATSLADLRKEQGLLATQLRESQISREEARRQAAQASAASQANLGALQNLFAQQSQQNQPQQKQSELDIPGASKKQATVFLNQAKKNINNILGQYGDNEAAIKSDFNATAQSAQYGNPIDFVKLKIYRANFPQLFGREFDWENQWRYQPVKQEQARF